jgi:hypothetical protein
VLGPESRSIPSASQSAFWRQRGPLHFESQSTSFSSHSLRINAVVFLMRSEKSDHQNAIYVLNQGNQPKNGIADSILWNEGGSFQPITVSCGIRRVVLYCSKNRNCSFCSNEQQRDT